MFEFVKRMLGFEAPAVVDAPPDTIATVTVRGRGRLGAPFNPAALTAHDQAATEVLSCRVVAERAPARMGDVAADEYRVDTVLPARADAPGLALFGPLPLLRLQATEAGTALRGTLLVHGGPAGRPTDGSIRMDDADLRQLLGLLPPDPSVVVFTLVLPQDDDEEPATTTASDEDDWSDDEDWSDDTCLPLYQELYGWTEPPAGAQPDPDLADQVQADRDVCTALTGLGYTVLPDPAGAVPAVDDAPQPCLPPPSSDASPDPASPVYEWAPAGGGYDR